LITKPLADKNRLKLGDTIHFNTCDKKTHYPFQIVGIFTTPAPVSDTVAQESEYTPYDHVFIPFTQSGYFDEDRYKPYTLDDVMTANFYLKDPGEVASFTNYAKKLLDDEYIEESNDDLYQTVVRPLAGVVSASDLLSIFTFAAGEIIFTLVIVFTLRGRRHEFGVLLAVGEKRARLLGQIFLETLLPVCVAACIGVAAGSGICGIIGNGMLSQKAVAVQEQQNEKWVMSKMEETFFEGLMGKSMAASPINKIDMSVSARELGQLAAACLALTAVSVSVPCIWVARCRPREILQQK
jgi:putative ABC transport system permease protein